MTMIMIYVDDTATNPDTCGVQEVQLANPEIDHSIWLEDPTGDYYVTVLDDYVDFNYTFLSTA
jgi:hypothetical protein